MSRYDDRPDSVAIKLTQAQKKSLAAHFAAIKEFYAKTLVRASLLVAQPYEHGAMNCNFLTHDEAVRVNKLLARFKRERSRALKAVR